MAGTTRVVKSVRNNGCFVSLLVLDSGTLQGDGLRSFTGRDVVKGRPSPERHTGRAALPAGQLPASGGIRGVRWLLARASTGRRMAEVEGDQEMAVWIAAERPAHVRRS
jgi:hypothetical protein